MRIVFTQKGVNAHDIEKRISKIKEAFPYAMVENFESFIEVIDLPDAGDRHILAAAIKAKADVIVTLNTKDFPLKNLEIFDLEAKTPDDFLTDLIDLNHQLALNAFREMVLTKSNPKYDAYEILNIFRNVGLKNTADFLHSLL